MISATLIQAAGLIFDESSGGLNAKEVR